MMICPTCHGGGEPSGELYCWECKGKGEIHVSCECGSEAVTMKDGQPVCEECRKEGEEDE
jgi:RecJ-like exonuclease